MVARDDKKGMVEVITLTECLKEATEVIIGEKASGVEGVKVGSWRGRRKKLCALLIFLLPVIGQ